MTADELARLKAEHERRRFFGPTEDGALADVLFNELERVRSIVADAAERLETYVFSHGDVAQLARDLREGLS
jgi:hypothetical protein